MARKRAPIPTQQNQNTTTAGAVAGGVGASMVSGAGGTTLVSCSSGDDSFYCKFVKAFNVFKMLLFIVAIVICAYLIYKMLSSPNPNVRKRR